MKDTSLGRIIQAGNRFHNELHEAFYDGKKAPHKITVELDERGFYELRSRPETLQYMTVGPKIIGIEFGDVRYVPAKPEAGFSHFTAVELFQVQISDIGRSGKSTMAWRARVRSADWKEHFGQSTYDPAEALRLAVNHAKGKK